MLIKEIETSDLFSIPKEIRVKAINEGVELFFEQCETIAELFDEPLDQVIDTTLGKFEEQLERELINENYELCYYLNEIIWGVSRKRNNI